MSEDGSSPPTNFLNLMFTKNTQREYYETLPQKKTKSMMVSFMLA